MILIPVYFNPRLISSIFLLLFFSGCVTTRRVHLESAGYSEVPKNAEIFFVASKEDSPNNSFLNKEFADYCSSLLSKIGYKVHDKIYFSDDVAHLKDARFVAFVFASVASPQTIDTGSHQNCSYNEFTKSRQCNTVNFSETYYSKMLVIKFYEVTGKDVKEIHRVVASSATTYGSLDGRDQRALCRGAFVNFPDRMDQRLYIDYSKR
jgi:hypothetical protein